MAKRSKNLLKTDPTRTITLRNRGVGEINRKYTKVQRLVTESIVTNKIFSNARALAQNDFVFLRSPDKLEAFDVWLTSILNEIILGGTTTPNSAQLNWMLNYFKESYVRGVKKTNNNFAGIYGRNQIPNREDVFSIPYHIAKTSLLFTRNFAQLKGITDVVSQQLSFYLSEGLLKGQNPNKIAKTLNERIDVIGKTRSRLLARTEIINTHNLGMINEGQALGELLGENVYYEWITAEDILVRDSHISRNNKFYTYEKVAQLIGEPNCRCAAPAIPESQLPAGAKVIGK